MSTFVMRQIFNEIGLRPFHLIIAGIIAFVWLALIISSAAGWSVFGVHWDFGNPGAFGDSFGPLNTFMATIAALGALAAYKSQANELSASRARQAEQDEITQSERARLVSREFEADRRTEKATFEQTFFKLLEAWRSLLTSIDVDKSGNSVSAHDAFAVIVTRLDHAYNACSGNMKFAWDGVSQKYRNDLNHYFRFLYHIVRFVDDSSASDKYFYIRFVRALLSESELILISLNCEYGAGREKFKGLIEKYALLHNLSDSAKSQYSLSSFYAPSAFERLTED